MEHSFNDEAAVQLRLYQEEIIEHSKSANTVAFLPTGSGKTLIACHVIISRVQELRKQSSKRFIAFICPKKVLLGQQLNYVKKNCSSDGIYVKELSGEKLVAYKAKNFWNTVCFMTPDVMRQLLDQNILPITAFDMVIFDECHYIGMGNDPMARLCESVCYNNLSTHVPLILGLTASPIASKKGTALEKMQYLESRMKSKFYVPSDESIAVLRQTICRPSLYLYLHRSAIPLVDSECAEDLEWPAVITDVKCMGSHLAYLARLRLQHCSHICDIHDTLKAMHSSPLQYPVLDVLHLAGRLNALTESIPFAYVMALDRVTSLVHQVLKVTDECGIYCGIVAFELGLTPLMSASACRTLRVLLNEDYWRIRSSGCGVENAIEGFAVKSCSVDATSFESKVSALTRGPFFACMEGVLFNHQDSICASLMDVLCLFLINLESSVVASALIEFEKTLKHCVYPHYLKCGSRLCTLLQFFVTVHHTEDKVEVEHVKGNCLILRKKSTVSDQLSVCRILLSSFPSCCDLMRCMVKLAGVLTRCISLRSAVDLFMIPFQPDVPSSPSDACHGLPLLSDKVKNLITIWSSMNDLSSTDSFQTTPLDGKHGRAYFLSFKPETGAPVFRPLKMDAWQRIKFTPDTEDVNSALIFVEMRLVAESLSVLFRNIAQFWNHSTELPPCPLIADCIHGDLPPELQREILRRMKSKRISVLFATAIAEEGLDIQSCQLIVNYDGAPKTVKSFIQRRGRARHRDSAMFSLVGDAQLQSLGGDLLKFVEQERELDQQLSDFLDSLCELGGKRNAPEVHVVSPIHESQELTISPQYHQAQEFRYVSRLGAFVDGLSATQLISNYCAIIGRRKDEYFDPQPLFSITKKESSNEFSCSLLLPQGTPPSARCTVAEAKSKRDAKGGACVAAVKALHEAGELNDRLCIASETEGTNRYVREASRHLCEEMKPILIKTMPESVHIACEVCEDGREIFHMYAMKVGEVCHVDESCFHTWNFLKAANLVGMAYRFPLHKDIVNYQMKIFVRSCGHFLTSCQYLGPKKISKTDIYHMERFHCAVSSDDSMLPYQLSVRFSASEQYLPPDCDLSFAANDHFEYDFRDGFVSFPVPLISEDEISHSQVDRLTFDDEERFSQFLVQSADEVSKFVHNLNLLRKKQLNSCVPHQKNANCHKSGFPREHPQLDGCTDHAQYSSLVVVNHKREMLLCLPSSSEEEVKTLSHPMAGYTRVKKNKPANQCRMKSSSDTVEDDAAVAQQLLDPSLTPAVVTPERMDVEDDVDEIAKEGTEKQTVTETLATDELSLTPVVTFLDNLGHTRQHLLPLLRRLSNEPGHRLLRVYMLKINDDRVSLLSPVKREKPPCVIYAVPELCSVMGYCKWYYYMLVAPSIWHRVKSLLLADDLRQSLNQQAQSEPSGLDTANCPRLDNLQEAMTHIMCWETFNSERLEMLGDNFLKFATAIILCQQYPNRNEGFMDFVRSGLVANINLCRLCEKHHISQYLRCLPHYGPEHNAACSRDRFAPITKTIRYKSLADLMESIIAVYFLDGGIPAGMYVMRRLGLADVPPSREVHLESAPYVAPTIPPGYDDCLTQMALGPVDLAQNISPSSVESNFKYCHLSPSEVAWIEHVFSYHFKNLELLGEALTHPSVQFKKSYQRLEFLGDSVLDIIVVSGVYEEQLDLREGGLTNYKQNVVSNKNLAVFTRHHSLYRFLYTRTLAMHELFARLLTDSDNQIELNDASEKLLGDICESLIGAIYVDSGGSLDAVRPVIEKIKKQVHRQK